MLIHLLPTSRFDRENGTALTWIDGAVLAGYQRALPLLSLPHTVAMCLADGHVGV